MIAATKSETNKRWVSSMSDRTIGSIINIFFIIYSVACIIPILLVISISFSDERSVIANGYKFIPEIFSTYSYQYLMADISQIMKSYGVSIFVTVVGTAISVILTALIAYPLSRRDLPYRNFFSFFIFFTMLFNGGLVPWYLVYTQLLHLQNTIWALIVPLLISPFFILITRTFFTATIPHELIEAAKIDGAGEFRIFLQVVLPLSLPVLATVALFSTLNYWNDWFLSLVFITDNSYVSLQYLMYKTMLNIQYLSSNTQASELMGDMPLPSETIRMAMAVIGIGPIVFAYPFFQRYFVKGLTVGSIKG